MKRESWLWLGLGSVGAILLLGRRRTPDDRSVLLGPPVDDDGGLRVTPHGFFGASRQGPPRHAHQGLDLAARPGSYVRAIGDGTIVDTKPGLGKIVRKLRLSTPAAWEPSGRPVDAVVYADLGRPLVQPGDFVRRGDPIALVDKRGFVHFAVKQVIRTSEVFFDPREAGLAYRSPSSALEVA